MTFSFKGWGTQACPFLIISLPTSERNPNYTSPSSAGTYRAKCTETSTHLHAYTHMHTT